MAREQWVMVGVRRIVAFVRWLGLVWFLFLFLWEEEEEEGERWMSGRLTTAREPRERGCSGSEIGAIRSADLY